MISSSSSTHNLGIDIRNLGTMSNFNIKNNIIVNNGNVGFLQVMNNNVNGLYIDNNILYNNANSDNPVISGSNYEFSGNIKANPLFVSSSDFHLQSQNSPAINNGVNVGLTKDYEGSSVPKGSAPDIGAYEYGSSVPVCTCASDGDVCTTDICQNNVCQHIQINNCCTSSSQCGSGQTCTGNACVVTSNPPTSTTGKVYYVATNGKDTNSGTSISSPFATINQAWSMVSAGDTIYVRGGTYTYSMIGETVLSGKSGTAGKMINILNYPEEKPIIDFSSNTFTF